MVGKSFLALSPMPTFVPTAMTVQPTGSPVELNPELEVKAPEKSSPGASAVVVGTLILLAIRLMVLGVGFVSAMTAKPSDINYTYASGKPWMAYDAAWYRRIMLDGYPFMGANHIVPPHIAYFPLLPAVAHLLVGLTGPDLALLIVSNLCGLAAFVVLYFWARTLVEPAVAFLMLLLLACYPAAVFLCPGYTEGPFLLVAACALMFLAKNKLPAAAIACCAASLLRPTAIALIATVFLWALVYRRGISFNRRFMFAVLLGLVAAEGGLAYESFLWGRYGKWNAYFDAQAHWVEHMDAKGALDVRSDDPGSWLRLTAPDLYVNPPPAVWQERRSATTQMIGETMTQHVIDKIRDIPAKFTTPAAWNYAIALLLGVAILVALIFPGPMPRVLLVLPAVIFFVTVAPEHAMRLSSVTRYETVAPPLFLILAVWMRRWLPRSVIGLVLLAALVIQVYYAVRFSRGLWVG